MNIQFIFVFNAIYILYILILRIIKSLFSYKKENRLKERVFWGI
jgi:hypothetical protein